MFELLTYPPILRGFLVILTAGLFFPFTGVYLLRLNLLTFRFMLMHGALLGGAIALSLGFDPLLTTMVLNIFLVLLVGWFSRKLQLNSGYMSTFLMVLAMGLAFALMYRFNVPAKDTMSILWGNLFAVSRLEVVFTFLLGGVTVLFYFLFAGSLHAVLFDREIAILSGVHETAFSYTIMIMAGITVALAMRLIGALLLDALILLPAVLATFFARSFRGMFLLSSLFGFFFSLAGFFFAVGVDIPVSSGVVIIAALSFGAGYFINRLKQRAVSDKEIMK